MTGATNNTGNGIDRTQKAWSPEFALDTLTQHVSSSLELNGRMLELIQSLTQRLETLEQRSSSNIIEAQPEDFGLPAVAEENGAALQILEEPEGWPESESYTATAAIAETEHIPESFAVVDYAEFARALSCFKKLLPANPAEAAVGRLRLSFDQYKVRLTGGSECLKLERELRCRAEGEQDVHIAGRAFIEAVTKLPKQELELRVSDDMLHVKAGMSELSFKTESAEGFSQPEDLSSIYAVQIPANSLRRVLSTTAFCGELDRSGICQHYSNGVLLRFRENSVEASATDGHRLAWAFCEQRNGFGDAEFLVPLPSVLHLLSLLPAHGRLTVGLRYTKTLLELDIDAHNDGARTLLVPRTLWQSKLGDVRFPNYEQLFTKDAESEISLNREQLADALKRICAVQPRKDNPQARFKLGPESLLIQASGEAEASAEIPAQLTGHEGELVLNPAYLLDAASLTDVSTLTLRCNGESKPVMLTSKQLPGWQYIQMPIRQD